MYSISNGVIESIIKSFCFDMNAFEILVYVRLSS